MVAEDAGAQADRVPGGDGPVGPHLQGQLVVVGGVAYTGVLHRVVDLAHRGIDGVHRDQANDGLGRLVPVGRHIAAAALHGELDLELAVLVFVQPAGPDQRRGQLFGVSFILSSPGDHAVGDAVELARGSIVEGP